MTTNAQSDEVAEDYKNSLEDLTINSRYEISNLTVIAKENMDHALAIARVLENHIRTAPPTRKLPALYVLDSVVKNVGTPYTLFFGHNLYQTFMSAYTLVDLPVRRKLEEMLKTWKEPVPGSLDPRPVFSPEVTRSIENALIKARTAAIQLQQQQVKSQHELFGRAKGASSNPQNNYRNQQNQPTNGSQYPGISTKQTQPHNYNKGQGSYGINSNLLPQQPQYPHIQTNIQHWQASEELYGQLNGSVDTLNNDIANLISSARIEFASNPYDEGVRQRLKALLDLQAILKSQQLPVDQIQAIREQVAQLSLLAPPVQTVPVAQAGSGLPEPPSQSQTTMFPPNALAQLLGTKAPAQQPPVTRPSHPSLQAEPFLPSLGQPPSNASSAPPTIESSLIASLRAAGMLPPPPTESMPLSSPMPLLFPPPPPNNSIPSFPSQILAPPNINQISQDIELSSNSLKTPRPHLIYFLYEANPNQCTSCGRRFGATPEGKEKKAAHLDWHFKVNQRMADAMKRGQNRSWYVDELEWIKFRELDESNDDEIANGVMASKAAELATSAANKDPRKQWIPVPEDTDLANINCPICQEKFETVWNDEAQQFVWIDAMKAGGKIFHASCHAEAAKDRGNTPTRNYTPDPVLGKRKAEVDTDNISTKLRIRKEPTA
ncbi:MAG: hypothetical protein M1829_000086 [Trizodia sp. TS-e1964]|nr:MAG: hypothetical protein M1829_000086 [Trizodia sp. TS-e1964]